MKKLILDTSELLHWWNSRRSAAGGKVTEHLAKRWARDLIALHDTDAIVTPIYIEIVGGTRNKRELKLMEAYLGPFRCIDQQRILAADWESAIRRAKRTPRDQRPRDLGDCLIRAIADRLHHDVYTRDTGFPG